MKKSSKPCWFYVGCIVIVLVGVGVALGIVYALPSSTSLGNSSNNSTASMPTDTEQPTDQPTLKPTSSPVKPSNPFTGPTLAPTTMPTLSSASSLTKQPQVNTIPDSMTPLPTWQPTSSPDLLPTSSEYAQIIGEVSPSGGVKLDDPDSYQSKALQWLESSTPLDQFTTGRVIQRYALACIYVATNEVQNAFTDSTFGADIPVFPWQNTNGWLTAPNECEWNGITCDSNNHVTAINLRNNILTGTMPPETGLIKTLTSLNLYNNYFYNVGDEGNNWLGELTNLEKLYIGSTSFLYDGIPPAIGKLTNLIDFDCSYTLYLGPLRGEIFENMNQLEYLYIGGNSYNSSIPEDITNLPNLQFFYAEDSNIIGDLSFMVGMPKISELWIDDNPMLTGALPTSLGTLVTLESFSATGCGLTGPIPMELGLLTGMQQMWLYGNALSGEIPTQLGALSDMRRLGIQQNDLSGSMPSEICNRRVGGVLEELEADCNGEVSCPTDCCTCCGDDCFD